ncbi:sine oculis-binding-like protein [Elysia marginata]|uniref:Sine oculis-binding-like protein n=1 Tax=Elysia marginata TaxID=1093978 RepID=A0AAV4JHX1_9GAST|nr:sine oculis-binding-like protein [Elysia marginata]
MIFGYVFSDIGPSDLGSAIICSWCQKDGTKLFTLATPAGVKAFCSEVCFTQCRRASFKKNKICDWCKHVRHTVNFVDLQEGDMQLQFCTEKCLNQYKMNIFCTEARQHLEQIQKMTGDGSSKITRSRESKDEILITPELWLSGTSTGVGEIKKEKPDLCDDDGGDGGGQDKIRDDLGSDNEEKEPGEVREKEVQGDALRTSMMGVHGDRQRKTPIPNHKYVYSKDINKNEKTLSGVTERSLPPHISGGSRRESPRGLASPNAPSSVSSTRIEPRSRNQRRSRERIRKLLVGEPVDRSCSPQAGFRDTEINPHRYPHVDHGTKRVAPSATAATMTPEQQLLGHPMFQHWATSQLLAMLPSMPSSLPASLSTPSAAAHLASLGYVAGTPHNMLYPGLFGAASLRPPAADNSTPLQRPFGAAQPRGSDALRSESTPVSLPSRHHVGGGYSNRRSANPSPLSHSSSNSSTGTPVPPIAEPTPPIAPDFAQLMTGNSALGPSDDLRALQSYLVNRATLPSGLSPSPAHAQHLSHLPSFPLDTSSAHTEILHFSLRSHSDNRPDGSATRQPPTTSQNQPTPLPPLFPQPSGVPPVTVLVPYPVAVPIPIPIPIPLPISPEKLFAYFEEKSKASNTCNSGAERDDFHKNVSSCSRHRSQSSSSSGSKMSGSSPLGPSSSTTRYPGWIAAVSGGRAPSSSSTTSSRGDLCPVIPSEHGEASDSISMLRREIGKSMPAVPSDFVASSLTTTTSQPLKRPRHASPQPLHLQTLNIDLSKRARTNSPSCSQEEENEAMDLRKPSSRTESPRSDQTCGPVRRFSNGASSDERPLSGGEAISLRDSSVAQSTHFPPRIHIVLNEEPPLSAGSEMNGGSTGFTNALPRVPDQSTYSSRRSRILDAPSIPRKTLRSPSPERRYVRTVPRDMVEAARRRGLRARVRTK